MQPGELERLYGALAESLGRVGEARAPLLLSTLALDLIASGVDADAALSAIARAERLCRR